MGVAFVAPQDRTGWGGCPRTARPASADAQAPALTSPCAGCYESPGAPITHTRHPQCADVGAISPMRETVEPSDRASVCLGPSGPHRPKEPAKGAGDARGRAKGAGCPRGPRTRLEAMRAWAGHRLASLVRAPACRSGPMVRAKAIDSTNHKDHSPWAPAPLPGLLGPPSQPAASQGLPRTSGATMNPP